MKKWLVSSLAFIGLVIMGGCLAYLTYHDDYHITAQYCNASNQCAYVHDTINGNKCPDWYETGLFASIRGTLKLKEGTCEAVKR